VEEVEIKKKEGKKEKNNNYIVLIIIGSLISLLLIGGAYYFIFVRDDGVNYNGNDNGNNAFNNDTVVYKSDDGMVVYLTKIDSYDNLVFELSNNDKVTKVFGYNWEKEMDNFEVYNDNVWYLFNRKNKKIVAYYESENNFQVVKDLANDKDDWYIIYEKEKIVCIVNENNGAILSFNDNHPDTYAVSQEMIYLKFNNQILKYDSYGKQIEVKKYDKIITFNINESVVLKNNAYYYVSLKDNQEVKFEKVIYKGNDKNLEMYTLPKTNNGYKFYDGLLVYDKDYYVAYIYSLDNGYDYVNLYVDSIDGGGQYHYGSFLVNMKTKEFVSFNVYSSNSIYKVSKGYYFANRHFEEGDPPYEVPQSTKKVTTSTGKTLKGNGMYTVTGDNLTIEDGSNLVKYDINGNIVSNLKCDKIYLINDGYAFVKIDSKYYVIDITNNFKQKQVELIDSINPDKSLYIYKVNNEEMLYMKKPSEGYVEYEVVYTYNFNTKKLETTIND